jgi:hypothetical protein
MRPPSDPEGPGPDWNPKPQRPMREAEIPWAEIVGVIPAPGAPVAPKEIAAGEPRHAPIAVRASGALPPLPAMVAGILLLCGLFYVSGD